MRTLSLLLALAATGCAGGAPPGFSSGDAWVFPLVGPLEHGVLITPVTIGGNGPYLFVLDPDASASSLDDSLAVELDLVTGLGPRLIDETDTSRQIKIAEVPALTIGTLTVKGRVVSLHPSGAYATDGRDVRGVLGRDVIADSLVFGFDRDAGVAFLATREAFTPPAQALRISYRHQTMRRGDVGTSARGGPTGAVPRRVAKAQVNGAAAELHLDLGAVPSQLNSSKWKSMRLVPVPYRAAAIDELATTRLVDKAGIANHVEAGGASAMGLVMIPYVDRRWDDEDVDGALGLNFFAPYKVWADWHDQAIYLLPRDGEVDGVAERIARWNAPVLTDCKKPACASARLISPSPSAPAPTPPLPPPVELAVAAPPNLLVERDAAVADLAYELLLEAVGADGRSLGLPRLVATFGPGTREIRQKLSPAFAGARFLVLDVSPYLRVCPKADAGCVFELTPAR